VSLNIHDLSICFVSSHLAAHFTKTVKRNDDFKEICKGIKLGHWKVDMMNQFHILFWMGDLNYRVAYGNQDGETPSEEVFREMTEKIKERKYAELLSCDQLTHEMKEGRVFLGFQEGKINFPPTFKVLRGQEHGYTEERSPAWCDRVLWRTLPGFNVTQDKLNSAPLITTSDHKPVFSTFTTTLFQLPLGRDDGLGECLIFIRKLKGTNLPAGDVSKTSDPFVIFCAPWLLEEERTTAMSKTLNPQWSDEHVPVLRPLHNSKARLAQSFLMIKLYDHDRFKRDEALAHGVLMLQPSVISAEQATPFQILLTSGGQEAGVLSGEMTISWASSSLKPLPRAEAIKRHDT